MRKVLLIVLFLFISKIAFADVYDFQANLKDVSKKMPEMHSIKCKFKQEKHIKNISKPLVSSGDFEYRENKGVYFHTKYPIESKTDYTSEGYKRINDIVKAISNKKYSKLENEFNFYHTGNADNWVLGMKPKKTSDSNNYISSITIQGSSYIQKININQANGNETIIWFTK